LQEKALATATFKRHEDVFKRWIFPAIGDYPVAALTDTQITEALRAIDKAARYETARRAHQRILGVLQLAKGLKLITHYTTSVQAFLQYEARWASDEMLKTRRRPPLGSQEIGQHPRSGPPRPVTRSRRGAQPWMRNRVAGHR
jgi:hypothetical protein